MRIAELYCRPGFDVSWPWGPIYNVGPTYGACMAMGVPLAQAFDASAEAAKGVRAHPFSPSIRHGQPRAFRFCLDDVSTGCHGQTCTTARRGLTRICERQAGRFFENQLEARLRD